MAICLGCMNREAKVTSTRITYIEGGEPIQMRFMRCPNCGIVGQEIKHTGPSRRKDLPHNKVPGEALSPGTRLP